MSRLARQLVREELKQRGIEFEEVFWGPYQFLVEDRIRISIRYCKKRQGKRWQFYIGRRQTDVFVFVTGYDDMFIVPEREVPNQRHMLFTFPLRHARSKGRWQSYKDNWKPVESQTGHTKPKGV